MPVTQWDQNIPIGDGKPYQFRNTLTCVANEQEQPVTSEPHTTVKDMSVGSQTNSTNNEVLKHTMGSLHYNNIKEESSLHNDNSEHETRCIRQDLDTTEKLVAVEEVLTDLSAMHAITASAEPHNLSCQLNNNAEDISPTTGRHMLHNDIQSAPSGLPLKPSICQLCGDACANEEILRLHICTTITPTTCITTNSNTVLNNRTGSVPNYQSRHTEFATRRCYVKLYDCINTISSQCSTSHMHNAQSSDCSERNNALGRNDAQNYGESTNGNINKSVTTNILQADHDKNTDTAVVSSYKCQECNVIFKRKARLKQHLQIHLQPFKCKKCGDSFYSELDLQDHCYIHTSEPYECDHCGTHFADLGRLQRHSRTHEADNHTYSSEDETYHSSSSSKNPVSSLVCTKTKDTSTSAFSAISAKVLTSNGDLVVVVVQSSLGNGGTSENCGPAYELNSAEQSCSVQSVVSKSVDNNSSDYVKPNSSMYSTVGSSALSMGTTEGNAIQTPEVCSAVNIQQQTVVSDLTRRSTIRSAPIPLDTGTYKCDICEKVFKSKSTLTRHMNAVHSDFRSYKCEECGRFYPSRTALSKHAYQHLDRSVLCKICGKRFTRSATLRMHVRSHTGEKPFKCSQCPAAFSRASSFKIHFRIHSGEKPYKCTKCDAAFTYHKALSCHLASHSNKRPYLCEICGAAFRVARSLRIHRRIHSGVKPYRCSVCGSSFTVSGSLKIHMRIHSGARPYKCAECGSTFIQKEHLKKHIRTMHN